ncbi:MAG: hypothetical protein Q9214_008116, partial [Letrouitia sp. 1 TL-2023]
LNISESVNEGSEAVSKAIIDEDLTITATSAHHDPRYVFCGRENGTMAIYLSNTGQDLYCLSDHGLNLAITRMQWSENGNMLLAVDISGGYSVQKLIKDERGNFQHSIILQNSGIQVQQVILSSNADRLLVSTADDYKLYDLGGALLAQEKVKELEAPRLWTQHPTNLDKLLMITGQQIRTFEWSHLQECSEPRIVPLLDFKTPMLPRLSAEATASGRNLCIYHAGNSSAGLVPSMRVFSMQSITSNANTINPAANFNDVAKDIK